MRYGLSFIILLMNPFLISAQNLYVVHQEGPINPVAVEFIVNVIHRANDDSASAVVIQLDTPGGLMKSMRMIVKEELNSKAPVIVFVAPAGARAGSAGVFITMAAHYAAMAPGTNIGAAHPVGLGGAADTSTVMTEKIVNDAVASLKAIAKKRNRNEKWAEQAVRYSSSIPAEEAAMENVVDFIADNISDLIRQISQKQLHHPQIQYREYGQLTRVDIYKSIRLKILDFISDPTIAYILLLIGIYGILFELYNPGTIFPGVMAVLSLILAFYAMQTLSVNFAGFALIVVGFVLFILEIKITSYGLLTIGGIVSFILGSIMLFDTSIPGISIPWSVIIAAALFTLLFTMFALGMAVRAQKRKVTTGFEGMVGETAIVATPFKKGTGMVYIKGEVWRAKCLTSDKILKEETVRIKDIKDMILIVEKIKEE